MSAARQPSADQCWTLAAAILALGTFLVLQGTLTGDLYSDEIWALDILQRSWRQMLAQVRVDWVHPPLFYLLMKLWLGFWGPTEWALRSFPILCHALSVLAVYFLGRRLASARVGWWAALFLATSPIAVMNAQFVRMYALYVLTGVLSLFWFIPVWRGQASRWTWVGFGVSTAALMSTHYFGWWIWLGETAALLMPGSRFTAWKRWAACQAAIAAAVIPWGLHVLPVALAVGPSGRVDWIPVPGLSSLLRTWWEWNGWITVPRVKPLGLLFWAVPIAAGLRWWWMARRAPAAGDSRRAWLWLLLLATLPILATFAVSRMAVPMYSDRYFLGLLPCYALVLAWGAEQLPQRLVRRGFRAGMAAWAVLALGSQVAGFARVPFEAVTRQAEQFAAGHLVLTENTFVMNPLGHYARHPEASRVWWVSHTSLAPATQVVGDRPDFDPGERFVLVWYGLNQKREILGRLEAAGHRYRESRVVDFLGLGQERNRLVVSVSLMERAGTAAAAVEPGHGG